MTQVEALHLALQQSFSPEKGIRDAAEASIKHLKFVPGSTQMLLAITDEKQVRKNMNEGLHGSHFAICISNSDCYLISSSQCSCC